MEKESWCIRPRKWLQLNSFWTQGGKKKGQEKSASGPPLIERSRRLEAILFILILRFLLFYSFFFFSYIILYIYIYTFTYIGCLRRPNGSVVKLYRAGADRIRAAGWGVKRRAPAASEGFFSLSVGSFPELEREIASLEPRHREREELYKVRYIVIV